MRSETSFRSRRTAWREDVLQGRGGGKEEEEPRFPKEHPHRRATVMDATLCGVRCVGHSRRAIAWVRLG